MNTITQDRLRELFDYDPLTGLFTTRVSRGSMRAGKVSGSINSCGYVTFLIDGRRYKAHRLAFLWMTGAFPDGEVDHINHVRSDNRWLNLRAATVSQNRANQAMRGDNTSGVKGVCFDKAHQRYMAYIKVNGRFKNLGRFTDINDAAAAYEVAARKYFGDFAHAAVNPRP
jgi:AP2 domain.